MPGNDPVPIAGTSVPLLPTRSRWAVVSAVAGMFFGGGAAGSALTLVLARDSVLAPFVGFLTLPLVFGLGYQMWQARIASLVARRLVKGLIAALWHGLIHRRTPHVATIIPTPEEAALLLQRIIQAASAFTYAGMLVGIGAGLLVGVATNARFVVALVAFVLVSTAYGRALTKLARSGYLPAPED
jgi:hypothetical protein